MCPELVAEHGQHVVNSPAYFTERIWKAQKVGHDSLKAHSAIDDFLDMGIARITLTRSLIALASLPCHMPTQPAGGDTAR